MLAVGIVRQKSDVWVLLCRVFQLSRAHPWDLRGVTSGMDLHCARLLALLLFVAFSRQIKVKTKKSLRKIFVAITSQARAPWHCAIEPYGKPGHV